MEIGQIKVGQKIKGPSGAVYSVIKVEPAYITAIPITYPQVGGTPVGTEFDRLALERFTSCFDE